MHIQIVYIKAIVNNNITLMQGFDDEGWLHNLT